MNRIERDDVEIHFETPPPGFNFDVWACDTEFFGQDKEKLHRPHGRFGCLGATRNGRDVYMIFDPNQIQQFMDNIDEGMHVWANYQYDCRQMRKYANIHDRKQLWDVMLVEQIRFSGYYNSFALNDLARRYLNIYLTI